MQPRHVRSAPVLVLLAALVPATSGCRSSNANSVLGPGVPAQSAGQLIPATTVDQVAPIAQDVFRLFFRIDPDASTPRSLISRPSAGHEPDHPGRVRDAIGPTPSRHRQMAGLYLVQQGPDVEVRCVVRNERLDTAVRTAFASQRGDDRPTETPIDRSGAASTDTSEEWVLIGRDRQLEREILNTISREMENPEPLPPATQTTQR